MAVTLVSAPEAQKVAKQVQAKSSRCVAFDEKRNVEYKNKQWSAEECHLHWFTAVDYQDIKDFTHSQAMLVWMSEKKTTSANSYKKTILRLYDACCAAEQETNESILSAEDQARFTEYIGTSNTRAGIEKLCIREIAHDKKYRRGELAQTVLALQASTTAGSRRSQAELIRLSSETISRASRLFARHMAVALADALKQEE